jgi:hypothetical protein
LAFPAAPPWPWRMCADLRGYPIPSHQAVGGDHEYHPLDLRRASGTIPGSCRLSSPSEPSLGTRGPSSGASGSVRTPLFVFQRSAPPPTWLSRVHSQQVDLVEISRPSARSCHLPSMFRPCRSSRLRRFTPHRHPAGLLHPAAGHGVRHVSGFEPPTFASEGGCLDAILGDAIPSGAFPSTAAVPRHRGPYPHAVAPHLGAPLSRVATRLGHTAPWRSTSRSCSTAESVAGIPALPPSRRPLLPWAFNPRVGSDRRSIGVSRRSASGRLGSRRLFQQVEAPTLR